MTDRHIGAEIQQQGLDIKLRQGISTKVEDIIGRIDELTETSRFGNIKGDDTFMTVDDLTLGEHPEPCVILTDGVTRQVDTGAGIEDREIFFIKPISRDGVVYVEQGMPGRDGPYIQPGSFEYILRAGSVSSDGSESQSQASLEPGPHYQDAERTAAQELEDADNIYEWFTDYEALRDAKIQEQQDEKSARRKRNFTVVRRGAAALTFAGSLTAAIINADDAVEWYQEATAPTPQERADRIIDEVIQRERDETRRIEEEQARIEEEAALRLREQQKATRTNREESYETWREVVYDDSFPDVEGRIITEQPDSLPVTDMFRGDERPPRFDGSEGEFDGDFYRNVTNGPRLLNAPDEDTGTNEGYCVAFKDVKWDPATHNLVGAHTGGGGRIITSFIYVVPVEGAEEGDVPPEEIERELIVCDNGHYDPRDGSGSYRGDIIIQAQPIVQAGN